MKEKNKNFFTDQLNDWHDNVNARSLPWKEEKNPYKIWLSEIILQQTRAAQGLQYYLNFTEKYPSICHLSQANDEDVFRMWQGLGYYNRCKNLLATARFICNDLNGEFPAHYEDILSLKGIGHYTAAAIASFAYDLPYAVVDGNVYRVLSRYFGNESPIDTTEGKKLFSTLAQELLRVENPAAHNQAIMDLGATVCTPKLPKCESCPLNKKCIALKENTIQFLPVKSKKLIIQNRYFNFVVFRFENEVWIQKRVGKDIWQSLHQFYLIESEKHLNISELKQHFELKMLNTIISKISFIAQSKQRLTHQLIDSKFYIVQLIKKPNNLSNTGFWISLADVHKFAFPKSLVDFLKEIN